MAKFPHVEAEIMQLARRLLNGLENDLAKLGDAPITAAEFEALINYFASKSSEAIQARATAKRVTNEKKSGLRRLKTTMRRILKYAESVNTNKTALTAIGWSAKAARKASEPPSQPLELTMAEQGNRQIKLRWRAGVDGGKTIVYKIQRAKAGVLEWQEIGSSLVTEYTAVAQPHGVELLYHVVAMNKAGDSLPSNDVIVML